MSDKKALVADSLKRLFDKNAIIIDTETTGFSKKDEVIDLAVISFQTGQVIFQQYFIPEAPINPFAAKVHKLDLNKLNRLGAKPIYNYFQSLDLIFSSDYPIIAYNASFDKRLLDQSLLRYNKDVYNSKWHCAMKAFEMVHGKQVKLAEACDTFNIGAGLHSAQTDCLALRNLLLRIIDVNSCSSEER